MKIEFCKDEGIIILRPKKKHNGGYDLEISFGNDQICFSIGDRHVNMTNSQISYEEFAELLKLLNMKIIEYKPMRT